MGRAVAAGAAVALALGCGGGGGAGGGGTPGAVTSTAPTPVAQVTPPEPPAPEPRASLLPLAVGHRWTYELRERRGAGPRFLGFSTQPAEETVLGSWELEIGAHDPATGRYTAKLLRKPVEGMPSTTEIALWEEAGEVWMDAGNGRHLAIEARIPPSPVSSERVRCVAHVLGGVGGACPPVAGGPLGTAPGLHQGIVSTDLKEGAEAAQFLVGVGTLGLFIPGNQSTVERVELLDFRPGPGEEAAFAGRGGPLFEAWKADGGRTGAGALQSVLGRHATDPESVAAIVASQPEPEAVEVAKVALPRMTADDRQPVLRTALDRAPTLHAVAVLAASMERPLPPDAMEAALAKLPPEAGEAAALMLTGPRPLLEAFLSADDLTFDDDKLVALEEAVKQHPVDTTDALIVARQFAFDDGRRQAAAVLVAHAPEGERAKLAAELAELQAFDEGRLRVIEDHQDLLRTLPKSRRRELVDPMFEGEELDAARAALGI